MVKYYIANIASAKMVGHSHIKLLGGGAPTLLSTALLLIRGVILGGRLVLATEIVSRRLWPGTPSNTFLRCSVSVSSPSPSTELSPAPSPEMSPASELGTDPPPRGIGAGSFGLLLLLAGEAFAFTDNLFFPGGVAGLSNPNLNAAAFVNRGAIAGGAVDATLIVSARLCPGTFTNVFFARSRSFARFSASPFSLSLRGGGMRPVLAVPMLVRGFTLVTPSAVRPCRSSAALVRRGWMEGEMCVLGSGRARKEGLPADEELDVRSLSVLANPGVRIPAELALPTFW